MYKVLIVEDEDMIRKGLSYTFDWSSLNCVLVGEAPNGQVGLEKIEALHPDIVLTDINMPLMDGIEMLQKSIESNTYCAIIISGYNEFHLAKKAIQLGAMDYLLKPLDHDQLTEAIQRSIHKVQERKALLLTRSKPIPMTSYDLLPDTSKNPSNHVVKIMDYIAKYYHQKITIQNLVDELEMSSTYLHNKFKKETNQTINEYLNKYRIQKSIELMKKGDGKIYTIASEVGFHDYKYFTSVFKKYTNYSPSVFLKHLQQGESYNR